MTEFPYTLSEQERELIRPALERLYFHRSQMQSALDELFRLLAMRVGTTPDQIHFDEKTMTLSKPE